LIGDGILDFRYLEIGFMSLSGFRKATVAANLQTRIVRRRWDERIMGR
jgi:hypothetical protein